jgi:hypothetical protein
MVFVLRKLEKESVLLLKNKYFCRRRNIRGLVRLYMREREKQYSSTAQEQEKCFIETMI